MKVIDYVAPPTCGKFMQSASFGRLLAGPVGSGKTTCCVFELLRRSCEQACAPDGIRHTRFAIVRQTLKQLKDTVLKDILSWLEGMVSYKVSDNTVYIEMGDVRSEWILIPLDSPEDQRRLLSMQLTGVWMSEAIEMPVALVDALAGRLGRYPSAAMGGATWFGMIADTNMPSEGSEWYKFMVENVPIDWQIFIQPGGLTEKAENYNWLLQTPQTMKLPIDSPARLAQGRSYYERLARGHGADWVLRYVHAQYGNDPSGTAVFRDSFNRTFHVGDDVLPASAQPLMVGQDFGRDPCSIIGQLDHKGRLLVLEEVIAEDIGLEQHIEKALRPALLQERYFGKPVAMVGDPSGISKSSIYEETTFDVLKRMGMHAFPAPTNDIDPRLRAVEAFLLGQRDGGPAFVIDRERCPVLVRALGGGYRYGKTRMGLRKLAPEKNEFSHVMDALQYLCLAAHGGMQNMITKRLMWRPRVARQKMGAGSWT
jgi:hypothetical protein